MNYGGNHAIQLSPVETDHWLSSNNERSAVCDGVGAFALRLKLDDKTYSDERKHIRTVVSVFLENGAAQ